MTHTPEQIREAVERLTKHNLGFTYAVDKESLDKILSFIPDLLSSRKALEKELNTINAYTKDGMDKLRNAAAQVEVLTEGTRR